MKIKIPGFAIEDPEIKFVSLVKRGANREPFKILKSEDAVEGGQYKNAEYLPERKTLVEKVEGRTVNPASGGKPASGAENMKGRKLTEAVGGDLDGLTLAKSDTPEAPIAPVVTAPAEIPTVGTTETPDVAKNCSDGPAHSSEVSHPTSSGADGDGKDPEDAADAGADGKKKKKSAPPWAKSEVMIAKVGDKEYEYALNEEGVPTFISWLTKDEEAPAAKSEEANPAMSQEVLLKAIADLTAIVAKTNEKVEALTIAKTETPPKAKPVVKAYDSDFDESLATPSMANGHRRLAKTEDRESVFAGLIPEFDALEAAARNRY